MNRLLLFLAAAALCAGCSHGEQQRDPLVLSAQRGETPATRATANNTWNGGEQVSVVINGGGAQIFTAASSGILTPGATLYWQNYAGSSINARAWYPQSYSFAANQSAGIQAADFIFAPEVSGITAGNFSTSHQLIFYHKTAKVTATLTHGTGITAGDVSGATVHFLGYTGCTVNTDNGAIIGSSNGGAITPHRTDNTCTALLVPQDMTGKQFIKVTVGGQDYYYTPAAGEADLKAGKAYEYQITVTKVALTVTVVSNGASWTAGSTETAVAYDHLHDDPGVVIAGLRWATRNVDAPGTFAPTPESYGMFYQWNRNVGWSNSEPLLNSDGGNTWDATNAAGDTWAPENNPCPAGWRVPTHGEMQNLVGAGYSGLTSLNGIYGRYFGSGSDQIFLPAAGNRNYGSLSGVGSYGNYWNSSSVINNQTHTLFFASGGSVVTNMSSYHSYGFSVRCVQNP